MEKIFYLLMRLEFNYGSHMDETTFTEELEAAILKIMLVLEVTV